jgi:hypothetical protein
VNAVLNLPFPYKTGGHNETYNFHFGALNGEHTEAVVSPVSCGIPRTAER